MKASLLLALLVLSSNVTRAQDITGPNIDQDLAGLGDGGCDAFCDPVDAHTIDPDTVTVDANDVGRDAADLIGVNDYVPNEGPFDFYRAENNVYFADGGVPGPDAFPAQYYSHEIPVQFTYVGSSLDAAFLAQAPAADNTPAVQAQAADAGAPLSAADNRSVMAAPYMDYEQALALAQRQGSALAPAQTPRSDVAAAARLNRAAHATFPKGSTITNQGGSGALQVCDTNGANCHVLQFH